MSTDSDKQECNCLQHETEHGWPHKRSSVLPYLVILFVVTLLLLLTSYFMQQRANQKAMDKLEQISDSTTQFLENIFQEDETLRVKNEALSQQVAQFQEVLEDAESTSDGEAALIQLGALCYLNQIRALYNDRHYSDTRNTTTAAEAALAGVGDMEEIPDTAADGFIGQQRQDYNLLGVYQSLMEWLG